MDISGITSVATALSQTKTATDIQVAVLKRAMEIEAQGALQLVQAATAVALKNPPHLGSRIDILG